MTRKYVKKSKRNYTRRQPEDVLHAAMTVARNDGFGRITRDRVAAAGEMPTSYVYLAYAGMEDLREAVMREAVATGDLVIVGQGLAIKHPIACEAPVELKQRAINHLSTV